MFTRYKPTRHSSIKPFGFEVGSQRNFFRTTPVRWPVGAERVLTLVGSADHSCSQGVMRHLISQALSKEMGIWYFGCKAPGSAHYLLHQDDKQLFRELHFGTRRLHLFNPIYRFSSQEVIKWCELALSPSIQPPVSVQSSIWEASVLEFWSALVPLLVEGEQLGLWDRGLKRLRHACSMIEINNLIENVRLDPVSRKLMSQWMQDAEHAQYLINEASKALSFANVYGFEDGIADFDALSVAEDKLRVVVSGPYGIGRNQVNLQLMRVVMSAMIVAQGRLAREPLSHLVVIDGPMYVLPTADLLVKMSSLGNAACMVLASIEDEMQIFPQATFSLADMGPLICLGRKQKGFIKQNKIHRSLQVFILEDQFPGKINPIVAVGSYRADRIADQLSDMTAHCQPIKPVNRL